MEKESLVPRPNLLDVVEIDGRLAQVVAGTESIIFLDDRCRLKKLGRNLQPHHLHHMNWDEYDFEKPDKENPRFVSYLREIGKMSPGEHEEVYWGAEQEQNPGLRDYVTFFGIYESRNR